MWKGRTILDLWPHKTLGIPEIWIYDIEFDIIKFILIELGLFYLVYFFIFIDNFIVLIFSKVWGYEHSHKHKDRDSQGLSNLTRNEEKTGKKQISRVKLLSLKT